MRYGTSPFWCIRSQTHSSHVQRHHEDHCINEEMPRETSKMNATNAFTDCVPSLGKSTAALKIHTLPYINVAGMKLLIQGLFGINASQSLKATKNSLPSWLIPLVKLSTSGSRVMHGQLPNVPVSRSKSKRV